MQDRDLEDRALEDRALEDRALEDRALKDRKLEDRKLEEPRKNIGIALVTTELSVGGAERCLTNLAMQLGRDEEFSPVVYSLAPPPAEDRGDLVRQLRAAGIPVHFLGVTRSGQFPQAVLRLRRRLLEQRPRVLQAFLFHANVVGTVAASLSGVPNVVTGIRVADPTVWRHRVERSLAGRVRTIVCVSRDVERFSREVARLPSDKLQVIPNGIEIRPFVEARPADLSSLGIPAGVRPLIGIGRLHDQKGFDWLLRTLPPVFAAVPEQRLLLVGDGPQRDALQSLTRQLGLADRVHFAGWRPDVPQLLAAASVLLLPSRYEGMPNVVLESMAAGRPVLAARVSGVAELLGPLAESQSFAVGDADACVRKLLALLDKGRFDDIGAANGLRAAEYFTLDQMAASYAELYRSLAIGK